YIKNAVMINIGIGLGKNDREVSDSNSRSAAKKTLLITHIGKSQVTRKNIAFFIALSETGKNVFSDTNSSEKNNDNFNSRWPFLFNAYGGDTAIERWQQYLRGWKEKKEILQKLDILDKKAETCLLSTQEDGLKKHITSYYKSLFGPTAMNRLPTQTAGVMVMKGFSEKW
ncbi:hypothetical protein ACJX0J_001431, partial [Zea mays]